VELTKEIKLPATGDFCENQIVRVVEFAYDIQSHFELTEEMYLNLLRVDPDTSFNPLSLYQQIEIKRNLESMSKANLIFINCYDVGKREKMNHLYQIYQFLPYYD